MKQVLVVHPFFASLGGAELAAVRVIEWLTARYGASVTLLALESGTADDIQAQAGVRLPHGLFSVRLAPCPGWLMRRHGWFQLKLALLQRHAKTVAAKYNLCISTYNEADFGRPGFQYVHHPNFLPRTVMNRYHMIGTPGLLDRLSFLESLYRSLAGHLSHNTVQGYRKNQTAVSSHFMREILQKEYGIASSVLYPTFAAGKRNGIPAWEERRLRFISVGRFSPDKKLLELVDLFAHLRPSWPGAEFMIVGKIADPRYFRAVLVRARAHAVPLTTVTDASRERLDHLLKTSMVYIGPKKFEHFGLAVLEAANAGCLTFVHDSGGQREIIRPSELRYTSGQDLAARVAAVLRDERTRTRVLQDLREGMALLTLEDFFSHLDRLLRPLLDA